MDSEILNWLKQGKPVPPPHIVKQSTIKHYATTYGFNVFVETGTYLGDMVNAMLSTFRAIYSIELDPTLHAKATERFSDNKSVTIFHGDSGKVIPDILKDISEPCLFWLDGHYSGGITARGNLDTPIMQEISHILEHRISGHLLLIDDARLFTGSDHYPSLTELNRFVLDRFPNISFEVRDDIIRIHF